MILYGATICAIYIKKCSDIALRRIHRRIAILTLKSYLTVSHDAALTLAGISQISMLAIVNDRIF